MSVTPSDVVSTTELPPLVDELVRLILEENPVHRAFLQGALETLSAHEVAHLEEYLRFCVGRGLSSEYLAECYLVIVGDTLREQVYFKRHGRYRYSTFAEVAGSVYFDDEYMSSYMYGLAITDYLWPNHRDIFRFFRDTLPTQQGGQYLEIGPGHGYFLMTAATDSAFESFTGVDISETSIAMTSAILEHFGVTGNKPVDLRCMDFLDCELPEGAWNAVVMGEVLEHVERPDLFMAQIARLASDEAYIFITTCLNAPAVDHIFLFEHPDQMEKLFADAGLRIEQERIRPYEGKTLQESLDERLAVNVAYVLRKA